MSLRKRDTAIVMTDKFQWAGPQPTVNEALAFSDRGLSGYSYGIHYERALRVLATEIRRLRQSSQPGPVPYEKCRPCNGTGNIAGAVFCHRHNEAHCIECGENPVKYAPLESWWHDNAQLARPETYWSAGVGGAVTHTCTICGIADAPEPCGHFSIARNQTEAALDQPTAATSGSN